MDNHIKPEGWSNWNNTENYKTARYSEYKSYGPGGDSAHRLSWTRQLTDDEAKNLTVEKVLANWKPFLN
jgi:pectinesterase